MRKQKRNYGEGYRPAKPLSLKYGQLTTGKEEGYKFSSTMNQVFIHDGYVTSCAGVKNPKDFDFYTLFNIAKSYLKSKSYKVSEDNKDSKKKKKRKAY